MKQNFRHTFWQALGSQRIPVGPNLAGKDRAHRFGVAARHHYAHDFPDWSPELEVELREQWGKDFDSQIGAIKLGWNSQYPQTRARPDTVQQGRKVLKHGVVFEQAER